MILAWALCMQTVENRMNDSFSKSLSPKSKIAKRVMDVFLAATFLILSVPLWLAVAVGTWFTLGRPLFFVQTRAGLGMHEFTIRKFRTMRNDYDANGILLPDQERQTPFARLVRRNRLDELPQLASVLRGDMAFVGPRPLLMSTIRGLSEFGSLRCSLAPGLTGWAQVNGNTHLTMRQKLALDLWYIEHRSVALDCLILLMTVQTVIFGEKANFKNLAIAEDYLRKFDAKIVTDISG
jgi:lipopolysaccharide/colanic/teichoic acid biosynthesis glycosyltransferase